ncbi:MAG: hypothetical protein ABJH08_00550 [Balneola sp.]
MPFPKFGRGQYTVIIKKYAYLVLVICAIFLGCDSLSQKDENVGYPVFIKQIDTSDLILLNERYHQKNNGSLCSTLNEYGFTGFSRVLFPNNSNPCLGQTVVKEELLYTFDLLEQAKQVLIENSEFTGVKNASDLITKEIISLDGCTVCEGKDINNVPLQWKFTFRPQYYNKVEVSESEIVVYIDAEGVNRIWGNWYPVIDPGFIDFGYNKAIEKIVGERLRYANEENQIFEQEILYDHISGEPGLRFAPIKVDEGIEIHKVWSISILKEDKSETRWRVYISTVTGEILEVILL